MTAANIKVRAMRALLLTPADYQQLSRLESRERLFAQLGFSGLDKLTAVADGELKRILHFMEDVRWRRYLPELCRNTDFNDYLNDYLRIWPIIKNLPSRQNRDAFFRIKGTEIDLQNIMLAYKIKKYYPNAQIYTYLIPLYYRLDKAALSRLAESAGPADLIAKLQYTPYAHVFNNFEKPEHAFVNIMRKVFAQTAKRYPNSAAYIARYFFDKRTEIRNIISLAEGLRYRLPPDEILTFIL